MLRHSSSLNLSPASDCGSGGDPGGNTTALGTADVLSLAAAPTFAVMALLAGVLGTPPDMLCSSAGDAPAVTGMVPMYALMSAFHSAPWLRLISGRRRPARRT
nr:hypothetical protein [Sinorhizobium sp. CCBAU 05631]